MNHPYHAGDRAEAFSSYLSYDGTQISLQNDSCMCMACHKDAVLHCQQKPRVPSAQGQFKRRIFLG
jgi:hypothetical protein